VLRAPIYDIAAEDAQHIAQQVINISAPTHLGMILYQHVSAPCGDRDDHRPLRPVSVAMRFGGLRRP
jgi:hypothetical protein